jgi:hypothetical protein
MRRDEKKSKAGMFMVIFISFIMITSIIGFIGGDGGGGTARLGDQKFKARGQFWTTSVDGSTYTFDNHPETIAGVEMSAEAESLLYRKPQIDFTSTENSSFAESIALAEYNLGLNLQNTAYLRIGFVANNSFGFPVITCADATAAVPVVAFVDGNSSSLSLVDNCIVATVRYNGDVHLVKDRILFAIIGI